MMTTDEVIEIYASHDIDVTEQEAAEDIAHAMSDKPTYAAFVRRIHGYAQQVSLERHCDACEARERELEFE